VCLSICVCAYVCVCVWGGGRCVSVCVCISLGPVWLLLCPAKFRSSKSLTVKSRESWVTPDHREKWRQRFEVESFPPSGLVEQEANIL